MNYEMKKMYIHQKGILFVGLFIVLSMILLFVRDKPVNLSFEESRSQYDVYLEKVEGRLTEQTEQFLLDESHKINQAKINLDKVYDSYYDGNITEDDFLQERNHLEEVLYNQDGFERIFEQYLYVRENPEQRYFLYTNGWDGLLSNDNLDFLIVLLILVLVTPVFCHEYQCAMNSLGLTMEKGGRHQAICKILLVLVSVAVLVLFSFGFRYLFFSLKYGLKNGAYPLQSLSYYSTTTKNVSLMETFIYTSMIKLLGYISFSALILFLSVWIKRYTLTLFASTAVILLPFFGMGTSSAKYIFTGPLGLMLANGFFRGNLYEIDQLTDREYLVFQEIPVRTIFILIFIVLCVMLLMLFILLCLRSNVWHKAKKTNANKRIAISIMLCIVLFGMTGCSHKVQLGYDIYNYHSNRTFQNSKYRFYVDSSNLDNERLVFEDIERGVVEDLVRTPLKSSVQIERTVYGNGDYVYYIKYNLNKSGPNIYPDRISVIEVDTGTFKEKIIYEKPIDRTKQYFMGSVTLNNEDYFSLDNTNGFFLDQNSIYFIGDGVQQVNRRSGQIQTINIPTNGNIAYDGQRIFFIGDRYQLSYYDTHTKEFSTVPEIIATKFFLDDNKVFFLNPLDGEKLYVLNLVDNTRRKILDKTVLDFYCDSEYIYYQDMDNLQEYRIDYNVPACQDMKINFLR
ncbi:ABC transporter permease [Marinisporobacter balticus]|uniref:DUF5050 domain-containing protein n=1 Tax=Marinisporobacter balticus TaxID=2018667 RepID=A0A4R2KN05_9FIRM|nr:ABC transporter permease [Marinisporobacter balticus]TCO72166.1 hypothetical protein EV214_11929 [Marinisporobacter balticus]